MMTLGDGLDFSDIRTAVIRIPEVSQRLKLAQRILDKQKKFDVDLLNFMSSDDETFRHHANLRSWVSDIVKLGLEDRLRKRLPAVTIDSVPAQILFRNLPDLLHAVVEKDEALNWFWDSVSASHASIQ